LNNTFNEIQIKYHPCFTTGSEKSGRFPKARTLGHQSPATRRSAWPQQVATAALQSVRHGVCYLSIVANSLLCI